MKYLYAFVEKNGENCCLFIVTGLVESVLVLLALCASDWVQSIFAWAMVTFFPMKMAMMSAQWYRFDQEHKRKEKKCIK